MRRVSARSITLVLVLLVGLGGGAGTASASDAGLRKLVSAQRAAEKRVSTKIDAAAGRIGSPRTLAQVQRRLARYTRTVADILRQEARSKDRYQARFRSEAPETTEASRGRELVLLGLRDGSTALRSSASRLRAVERRSSRVRTEAQARSADRAFDRALRSRTAARSASRLKRGRTLIRNAPAVPAPTPAPPTAPEPAPAPPATTTPAPPSLIPGLL